MHCGATDCGSGLVYTAACDNSFRAPASSSMPRKNTNPNAEIRHTTAPRTSRVAEGKPQTLPRYARAAPRKIQPTPSQKAGMVVAASTTRSCGHQDQAAKVRLQLAMTISNNRVVNCGLGNIPKILAARQNPANPIRSSSKATSCPVSLPRSCARRPLPERGGRKHDHFPFDSRFHVADPKRNCRPAEAGAQRYVCFP